MSIEADDKIYRKLAKFLDRLPVGFPATESGVEIRILKRLFTPEEALITLKLSIIPQEPREFYRPFKRKGYTPEEFDAKLQEMWKKGLINGATFKGKQYYSVAFLVIGIFEYQLHQLTKELMVDFQLYLDEAFREEIIKNPVQQLRPIPQLGSLKTIEIDADIDNKKLIASYDDIEKLIGEGSSTISVAECVCRQGADLLGHGCDHPKEVCFQFGGAAHSYIEKGIARKISKEEAVKILHQAQEAGLVLQPSNTQKMFCLCCCCGDSCEVLTNLKKLEKPSKFVSSNYYSSVISDDCTGCSTCVAFCPMDAIEVNDDSVAVINLDRCIGCGVCVVKCQYDAMKMIRKNETDYVPPINVMEMYKEMGRKKAELIKLKKSKEIQ